MSTLLLHQKAAEYFLEKNQHLKTQQGESIEKSSYEIGKSRFCTVLAKTRIKNLVVPKIFMKKNVKNDSCHRFYLIWRRYGLTEVCCRDEHWTGLGLDWIHTIANFAPIGMDPGCVYRVAIGNPERHMRKASLRGSKQQ